MANGADNGDGGLTPAEWETVDALLADTGYDREQLGDPSGWSKGQPGQQTYPEDLIRGGFNCSQLITDDEFTDDAAMSLDEIRAFLAGHDTVLNETELPVWEYDPDGNKVLTDRSIDVAAHIALCSRALQINPRVLLTILQKEESLVTGWAPPAAGQPDEKIGPQWKMVILAAGFGVYDGQQMAAYNYAGIDRQILLAAFLSRRLFDGADPELPTPDEYPATFYADEPVPVNNRATWVLYRYTPHTIDEHGAGNGFPQIWQALFGQTEAQRAAPHPALSIEPEPTLPPAAPAPFSRADFDLPGVAWHQAVDDLRQQFGPPEHEAVVGGTGEYLLFYPSKGFVADTVRDRGRVIGWYLTPGSALHTSRGIRAGASGGAVLGAYGVPDLVRAHQLLYLDPADRNLHLRFTLGADGRVQRISAGSGFSV